MPKAIIIGASSGIGAACAKELAKMGYEVGLTGRRSELLVQLQKEIPTKTYIQKIDVTKLPEAISALDELIQTMDGMDLCLVNSGVYYSNPHLDWKLENATIEVNVRGFCAMADAAMHHFFKKGSGHLVGISSISALRGEVDSPAYSASKAFVSNYLEGLRCKAMKQTAHITITDVKPGWVDTNMAKGFKTFWMAPVDVAAKDICQAIQKKRTHLYITARWRYYAWLLKLCPNWLYDRYIA